MLQRICGGSRFFNRGAFMLGVSICVDTEQKRKAIEKATVPGSPLKWKLNAERYTVYDDEILRKL